MRTFSKKMSLVASVLLVCLIQLSAQTNVSGILTANTTWTKAQSPYTLTGNVGVQSGVTLTIEPGVVVKGNYSLQVKGTLIAKGTAGDSVYFQGASDLRPRWPNLTFLGNNPVVSTLRVQFFSSNLSASSLVNSSFRDCYLQIGNGDAESPKNTGDLYVDSSSFRNCGVFTQGWSSYRSLNVRHSSITQSDIICISYSSDYINLRNCRLDGGTQVRSDNDSRLISIRASFLKNTDLSPGSSYSSSIDVDSCRVIDCTTFQTRSRNGSTQAVGLLSINRSIVVNTRLNKGSGTMLIDSSVLVFQAPNLQSPYISTNGGSIKNTAIIGNGTGELLVFTALPYGDPHTDYRNNLLYNGSTGIRFRSLPDYTDTLMVDGNNFISTQALHIHNETVKNLPIRRSFFEAATEVEIRSKIYDGYRDFNVGLVNVSTFTPTANTKAPIAPPAIVDKYASASGVVIRWAPNTESDIAGYRVYYGTFDGFSFSQQVTVPVGQDSAVLPGVGLNDLVGVTAYDAEARGTDDQVKGHESWYAFAPPSVPAGLTAEAGGRRVKLSWTASSEMGVRYNVYRKGLTTGNYNLVAGGLAGESYTDKALSADTIYTYFIKAVNSLGSFSEPSNLVTVQPDRYTYVSTDGSNNNLGGYNAPFRSIQVAIDSAADGDTLILKRGVYTERLNFKGKELTLSGSYILDFDTTSIRQTIIDASKVVSCSSCGDKIIRDSLGSQKVQSLVGLTLRGAESGFVHFNNGRLRRLFVEDNRLRPGGAAGLVQGDKLVVDSCVFRNNGVGEQFPSGGLNMLYLGTNSSFTNNQVYNNNVPGHYLAVWGVNTLVKNNTFVQNSYSNALHNSTGMILSMGNSLFSVENNVFANNSRLQAIYANIGYPETNAYAVYSNTITNNTFFNNSQGDISLMMYQGSATIQNNILYTRKNRPAITAASMGSNGPVTAVKLLNNLIGAAAGSVFVNTITGSNLFDSTGSAGNIGGYPGFVDTTRNDFRLLPTSIAIARGVLSGSVPVQDIAGSPRPSPAGTLPDLGAIESPYGYAAPTLTLVEGGNRQAVVRWSNEPTAGITHYQLYRSASPIPDTASVGLLTDTISAGSRQFTDTALANGTLYYYRMKAVASTGELSGMSNELSTRPNTPPARPDTLVAKAGPGAVQLSWPVVAGAGLKYQVFRGVASEDRKLLADTFAANTFFDTTVTLHTRYYYSVRAVDSFGVVSEHSPLASAVPNRIWWVGNAGSNSNIGTSDYPLQQISYALEKSASGDTIIVKKGVYQEMLRLTRNVVLASEYLLTGHKDLIDQTILTQDTAYRSITTESSTRPFNGFRYQIIGFTVKDNKRWGVYMSLFDCSLRDMKFVNNDLSDLLYTSGQSEIRNSVFSANKGRLINAVYGDSTSRTRVIDCQFLNNEAWWESEQFLVGGMRDLEAHNLLFAGNRATRLIDARGDSVVLQHLTMVRSGNVGLNVNTSKYAEIRNSIIVNNLVDVRFEKAPATIVFRNNLLTAREQRNGTGYDTTGFVSNLVGIDPVFLDTTQANYRLSPASLVLGQGDPTVPATTDLDGQARPQPANTNPDLGAYEHALAAPRPTTVLKAVLPYNKASFLRWSQFPDTLSVRKFRVYRSTTPGATTVVKDSLPRGLTQYTDSNLVNNTTYYYRLRAVDTTGAELDFSNEISVVPANSKPKAGFLQNRIMAIGFKREGPVSITPGAYDDSDGVVDSLVWHINGKRLFKGTSFNGSLPQGTNKVQYVVYDNDGASDTATAYFQVFAKQVSMKSMPKYGVSAFNRSNLFLIDTVLGTMSKSAVIRLDSLLDPSAGLNTFKVDEGISSEASVSADSIVFIPNGTKLDAFNINGQPHFQSPLALGGIVNVTPTVDNKRKVIYLGLDNKNFMAISYKAADNGAVKWNYVASAAISSPAVITRDGKLLFTDAAGRLYGFELEQITTSTSAPKWNYHVGGPIRKALALDTSGNVVLATGTALLKLRLKNDGTVEEVFKNTTSFSASPVNTSPVLDADGNIIVGQTSGAVTSLNGNNGSVKWSYPTGTSISSTPSISAYGHVYVLNEKNKLFVLNTAGELLWYYASWDTTSAKAVTNTLHVKGMTLIASGARMLYAFYDVPDGISPDQLRTMGSMAELRVPMWETYQGNIGRSGFGGGSPAVNVVTATPDVVYNDPSWKVYRGAGGRSLLVERTGGAPAKARAVVYDLAGQPVEGFDVSRRLTERPLPRLISGIYLVVIYEKGKTSVYKVFL